MDQNKKTVLPKVWQKVQKDYELLSLIGSGSFGQVIKARKKSNQQLVAIKLIQNIFRDDTYFKKVISEIQIMRKLSKMENNIFTTKIQDVIYSESKASVFIIMDYVDHDLKMVLGSTKNYQFTEKHVITIIYNCLCAMNFLHSAELMHRDIKPANILIDSQCSIKICDFGNSRTVPRDFDNLINVKSPRSVCLSPKLQKRNKEEEKQIIQQSPEKKRKLSCHVISRWYRPPEVILNVRDYDEAVDVWSLGCVLAEMIYCSNKYDNNLDHRHIFAGTSCYPLSPCGTMRESKKTNVNIVSTNDQLKKILDILGHQDEQSLSFIKDESAIQYQKSLVDAESPNILRKLFPNTSEGILDLLEGMLAFNPNNRLKIEQCLKLKVFDEVRKDSAEKVCNRKMHLQLYDENAYDYEKDHSNYTIEQMKKLFAKELQEMGKLEE